MARWLQPNSGRANRSCHPNVSGPACAADSAPGTGTGRPARTEYGGKPRSLGSVGFSVLRHAPTRQGSHGVCCLWFSMSALTKSIIHSSHCFNIGLLTNRTHVPGTLRRRLRTFEVSGVSAPSAASDRIMWSWVYLYPALVFGLSMVLLAAFDLIVSADVIGQ